MLYAILCSYPKLQGVLSQVFEIYQGLVKTYQENGKYPLNGPVEIRVSPIDNK
ncbi:cholesterol oxidase substrate-binding domain-containing protein, partial [Acinetobacter baumannii]|uniref:cholesterol oxidase substrate-binding domain-containing protein n=1 Tax=Acinetobacter baumannii TaxID=470 RepID=UPI00352838FD